MADNGNHKGVLSAEEIAEIRANSRTRGWYKETLKSFAESDEAGINLREYFPQAAKKDISALYQGFHNLLKEGGAMEELASEVEVLRSGTDFYLLRK